MYQLFSLYEKEACNNNIISLTKSFKHLTKICFLLVIFILYFTDSNKFLLGGYRKNCKCTMLKFSDIVVSPVADLLDLLL